jgi:hypothetical protein
MADRRRMCLALPLCDDVVARLLRLRYAASDSLEWQLSITRAAHHWMATSYARCVEIVTYGREC